MRGREEATRGSTTTHADRQQGVPPHLIDQEEEEETATDKKRIASALQHLPLDPIIPLDCYSWGMIHNVSIDYNKLINFKTKTKTK